jgi:hypothetical protein
MVKGKVFFAFNHLAFNKNLQPVIAKPAQHIKLLISTKLMRVEAIAEWKGCCLIRINNNQSI